MPATRHNFIVLACRHSTGLAHAVFWRGLLVWAGYWGGFMLAALLAALIASLILPLPNQM